MLQLDLFALAAAGGDSPDCLVKSVNYYLDRPIGSGGAKTRARRNLSILQLVKQLDAEGRSPTAEEQDQLVEYLSWGVAPEIFAEPPAASWETEAARLRGVLSEHEYREVRRGIQYAYFTAPAIIDAIYRGVEHLGFSGGECLEPACGTFLWAAKTPQNWRSSTRWTGVELDPTTGAIARYLQPQERIYSGIGFQSVYLAEDQYDAVFANPPFSEVVPYDPQLAEIDGLPLGGLHDYFLAKSALLTRPGGLIVFITSVGTLNAQKSRRFREWLAGTCNLVGAIALPDTAFKQFTKTEVSTHILVFQKIGNGVEADLDPGWIESVDSELLDSEGKPMHLNRYFIEHPEMVLGLLCRDKLYGSARLGVKGDGRNLTQGIVEAFRRLPQGIYRPRSVPKASSRRRAIPIPPELVETGRIKPFSIVWHDDTLWQVVKGRLEAIELEDKSKTFKARCWHLINIRNLVRDVFDLQLQGAVDEALSKAQQRLRVAYQQFVGNYGWINSLANRRVFQTDPEYPLLLALENYDPDAPEQTTQTDIFFKRVIVPSEEKTIAETPEEALLLSLNHAGRINPAYMADLLSEDAIAPLAAQERIFLNPTTQQWETAAQYLSGNVRQKLLIAEALAPEHVAALEAVQPVDLGPKDIYIKLGSPWVPNALYEQWIREHFQLPSHADVRVRRVGTEWSVQTRISLPGTQRVEGDRLIEACLNQRLTIVRDLVERNPDRYRKSSAETAKAQGKQEEFQAAFKRWAWADVDRAILLCQRYNEKYNSYRPPTYDGSWLQLKGMNPWYRERLKAHQLGAIAQMVLGGNSLTAHGVGLGKSWVMIAGAVTLKQLGIETKPLLLVMDHLVEQTAALAVQMYPGAKIFVANTRSIEGTKRKEMAARVATGNWDLVIMSHTAFSLLPLRPATIAQFIQAECEQLEAKIRSLNSGDIPNRVLKRLEKRKESLEQKIKAIAEDPRKDDCVYLEDLGIRGIHVDESQCFKGKNLNTAMQVLGVPTGYSKKAENLYMFIRWQAGIMGEGKGVHFYTGTPILNNISEAWVNQVYLQHAELEALDMLNFDAWASVYCEVSAAIEITPQGTLELKSRLKDFNNVPEWYAVFRQVADIRMEVPSIDRPAPTAITVRVPASDALLKFFQWIEQRAASIKNRLVEPEQDNFPYLCNDIRQGVVDLRLLPQWKLAQFLTNDQIEHLGQSKADQLIENVHRIWQETAADRATQIVFWDVGTPSSKGKQRDFELYRYARDRWVAMGIPRDQIAFVHECRNDTEKAQLFRKVREGVVRIILGSTATLGVGSNIHTKLIALHNGDCPWRPGDLIQRVGRIVRQGNEHKAVQIYSYVAEGKPYQQEGKAIAGLSPDGFLWQTVEVKARFIQAALSGNASVRSIGDLGDVQLNYGQIKASATGDPRLMEKTELEARIAQLQQLEQDHIAQQHSIRSWLAQAARQMQRYQADLMHIQADLDRRINTRGDRFSIELWTGKQLQVFTDRPQAARQLHGTAALLEAQGQKEARHIGRFAGFDLFMWFRAGFDQPEHRWGFELRGNHAYRVKVSDTPAGTLMSLEAAVNRLDRRLSEVQSEQEALIQEQQQKEVQRFKPFEQAAVLEAAIRRVHEISDALGLNAPDQLETAKAA